jgi:ribosomal 30S subunit maturation factor RimM
MAEDADRAREMIVLGRISGVHGVQGWVKVFSHTRPRERITVYGHWFLRQGDGWRRHPVWQRPTGAVQELDRPILTHADLESLLVHGPMVDGAQ